MGLAVRPADGLSQHQRGTDHLRRDFRALLDDGPAQGVVAQDGNGAGDVQVSPARWNILLGSKQSIFNAPFALAKIHDGFQNPDHVAIVGAKPVVRDDQVGRELDARDLFVCHVYLSAGRGLSLT